MQRGRLKGLGKVWREAFFLGAGNPNFQSLPKALLHYSSRWCISVPDCRAPEPAAFVSFGTRSCSWGVLCHSFLFLSRCASVP